MTGCARCDEDMTMARSGSDLNLFRVFHAIHEEVSLTRTGEVLHMTQLAVNNALARYLQRPLVRA